MYYGAMWMNDPRFLVPMTTSQFGQVYIGDFILFSDAGGNPKIARIKQFFCQVNLSTQVLLCHVYMYFVTGRTPECLCASATITIQKR